jgi:hypothetical protein
MASGGLRKKRNFKGLNLPTSPSSEDGASQLTIHSRLNLPADPETAKSAHASLTSTLRNLDINSKAGPGGGRKFDLKNEDLRTIQELGQGNGGSVVKVEHIPTGTIMAKKVGLSHSRSFQCLSFQLDALVRFQPSFAPLIPFPTTDHLTLSRSSLYLRQLTRHRLS